jgi:hypothetical protein
MHNDDQSRPNSVMALIVDHGIAMAETEGMAKAVAYLTARGVPDAVIARVLCEPGRRRGSGALSAQPARPSALERAA